MPEKIKNSLRHAWSKVRETADTLFSHSFVVKKHLGGEVLRIPLIIGILLIVLATKIVLILVLVALVAGYRFSVGRR